MLFIKSLILCVITCLCKATWLLETDSMFSIKSLGLEILSTEHWKTMSFKQGGIVISVLKVLTICFVAKPKWFCD